MPELPDLTVVADALHAALAGRPVRSATAPGPLAVRGTPAELDALVGQRVESIRRRGKFLLIDLERDDVVCNPMLTGRFQLAAPGDKLPTRTAVVLGFGAARRRPAADAAAWTAGAAWLPGRGRHARGALPRSRPRWARSTCVPAGVDRPVPGLGGDEQGPDADDPGLTLEVWRDRIRRHPGELKNLLRNQAFVAGIGNAYSDEVLHAARLLPFRKRSSLAAEEVDALYVATRVDPGDRDRGPRAASPADVREAGPRLPRRPRQGRSGVPALRDADHRGQGRRVHHLVLPGLPAVGDRQPPHDGPRPFVVTRFAEPPSAGTTRMGRMTALSAPGPT